MMFKRQKRRNFESVKWPYAELTVVGAFAALLVALLIINGMRAAAGSKLNLGCEAMAASVQNDVNQTFQAYSSINRKNADLPGDILPRMRLYMYSAYSMNKVLNETYGADYAMLSKELYDDFVTAMDSLDSLIAMGQSTDAGKEQLLVAMTNIESALNGRFTDDGVLLPKSKLKQTAAG